jgi:hypothetical protein
MPMHSTTKTRRETSAGRLTWIDERWHCDGRPIHAGSQMEMQFPDGTWVEVRIESANLGQKLFAHFDYHGQPCVIHVLEWQNQLRWPPF